MSKAGRLWAYHTLPQTCLCTITNRIMYHNISCQKFRMHYVAQSSRPSTGRGGITSILEMGKQYQIGNGKSFVQDHKAIKYTA